ncbi:MAG: murein biosynthesis integral membrane protein MurJ [Verrucomicrobiae bacterium]|nr:murein biosynthesis integral membrane protein MurJ [Verrucomicrobiae bacterium]
MTADIEKNTPSREAGSQARATGIVSVAILCSRVLGLVRDQLLNGLFGSAYAGIFNRAFGTPNMLRDLFAEGALSTAFVTTFARKIKLEGDDAAWALGRKMATLALCFMSSITAIGIAIAPVWIRVLNPGWGEPAKVLCAWLAQVMFPFITIVSLTALVMGMLNAKKIFFVPALASAFFNLGCIIGGLALAWAIDPGFRAGKMTEKGLTAFAIGTLIGGLAQLCVQLPSLRRVGFKFGLDFGWRDEGVREVLRLMWPSLIAAGGTQINVLLNAIFASFTFGKESAAAWLGNAQRLQQLPLGLFGVAVATVTLPMLSTLATDGITPAFRSALAKGLRLVLFLTLPCAVGLSLLAHPILSLIFEHGRFTAYDVRQTAAPLQAYAFGLVFYAGIKVVQPAFYTIGKRFIPMSVSMGVIALTAGANAFTVFALGWDHTALAWATAIGLALNFTTLYLCMRHFARRLETRSLLRALARIAVAIAAMAAICVAAKFTALAGWPGMGLAARAASLLGTIALGAAAYFTVSRALDIEESREFLALVARRFRRP